MRNSAQRTVASSRALLRRLRDPSLVAAYVVFDPVGSGRAWHICATRFGAQILIGKVTADGGYLSLPFAEDVELSITL